MSDRGDPTKAASRILRERAMAILRDTRARIDPALLAAMKERLSSVMPGHGSVTQAPPAASEPQTLSEPAAKAQELLKQGLFKRDYKFKEMLSPSAADLVSPMADPAPAPVEDRSGTEPVDRQKIAQIVLEYMKNREDKQKH